MHSYDKERIKKHKRSVLMFPKRMKQKEQRCVNIRSPKLDAAIVQAH